MTEHLDGSYPPTKIGKNRSRVMDIKMLTSMVCYFIVLIILGVSFCSLFDQRSPIPSRNNGESERLFLFYLFSRYSL